MPTSIAVNQTNAHTHSRYADLHAVNSKVVPVYAKHGFSIAFNTESSKIGNSITIIGELEHKAGHSKLYRLDDWPIDDAGLQGGANKTKIQGMKSTLTYAQRILTCLIWNVASGGDTDGNATTSKPQAEPYPDESFEKNFPKWKELIENGERKVGDIMTLIESKGKLTDGQKEKLRAIKPRN